MKHSKVKENQLLTPIIQYRRNHTTVTALGAIHIGTSEYYGLLGMYIDNIAEGFFEGIKPIKPDTQIPDEKRKYLEPLQRLGIVYKKMASFLGMTTQKENLSYNSWKSPDMSLDELIERCPTRFLDKFMGFEEAIDRLTANDSEECVVVIYKIMRTAFNHPIIFGAFSLLKNGPIHNKVILGERNQNLFDALEGKLDYEGELGIVYGAAHLSGINKFLKRKGFKREGELWIPAWELPEDISWKKAIKTLQKVDF